MKDRKRVVRVVIGSKSDLSQMGPGLRILDQAAAEGVIDWNGVQIGSIHWNHDDVIKYIRQLGRDGVDVIIIGAGAANHITGTSDAMLRRTDLNDTTHVIGVAFESASHPEWNETAIRSIIHVPGTAVHYKDYNGLLGFTNACHAAAYEDLPPIKLPTGFKKMEFLSREKVLAETEQYI